MMARVRLDDTDRLTKQFCERGEIIMQIEHPLSLTPPQNYLMRHLKRLVGSKLPNLVETWHSRKQKGIHRERSRILDSY